ncbi:heme biosynthesis HemY N-terminal domain-containing protein [Oligella urethralis]|uniref:HemY N-terminal domain-containing protein n=1 Tax=Oligella urethralis DNF00040 TaxID=1401065 RepID=A0A096BHB2_9BURK|nr:heme biosynthesis HemY N-terminal domain-containing protein [Oligella urethralis]KGF32519.1 hypothetical protein HMPREF2130_00825 [Oligella urethralis DNF00040]
MKTVIKLLLLIAIAVFAAVSLQDTSGYVSLVINDERRTVSLIVGVLILVLAFFVAYLILRLISHLLNAPKRFDEWREKRRTRRDLGLLERGWMGWLEGRVDVAEKDFNKLHSKTHSEQRQVLASLAAAKAAHQVNDELKRDEMLALSLEKAVSYPELYDAAATVKAEILLDQRKSDEAIQILEKLNEAHPNQIHIRKLLLRAYKQAGRLREVIKEARYLLKKKKIDVNYAENLIETSANTIIASPSEMLWESVYEQLSSEEQSSPAIAISASRRYADRNDYKQVMKVLEKAYETEYNPLILDEYLSVEAKEYQAQRLSKVQKWLENDPENPDLLRAAGHLCLLEQLWGQAERYLTKSLAKKVDPRTHALLGTLYDRLSKPEEALKHWRQGSSAVIVLPGSAALPSADTTNDPLNPPDMKNLDGPDDHFISSRSKLQTINKDEMPEDKA